MTPHHLRSKRSFLGLRGMHAAPGTDCMAIQTPREEDVKWDECLRTVQFDFTWEYVGPDDAKLISVKRDITNSLGMFPEETKPLVQSYWGQEIWTGWGLKNTYHQIVRADCVHIQVDG